MDKVLYVATYGDFFASFQIDNMKLWQELGCEVHCAANFNVKQYNRFTERIDEIGVVKHNIEFVRTPYSKKNIKAYKALRELMSKERITVLDTHNPVASILSRIAAKQCAINKIVYTVHGFFFYKGAPLKNKLIYKPIEFVMARLTDALIVTNLEDYEVAKKMKVRGKAYYVHGVGVDVSNITDLKVNRKEKREELGIPSDAILLCSIGECIRRKNQETSIRAFATIDNPNLYYVVVGDGELYEHLKSVVKELGVERRVILPGYRADANEILKVSDIYVFPSYQEGLSVALMQAMAAELPVVASEIRGNVDCVENGKGGITVGPEDIKNMAQAIITLISDPKLRRKYGEYNLEKVKQFGKDVVRKENNGIFSAILKK